MAKTLVDLDVQAKLQSATNQIIADQAINNAKVSSSAAISFSKLAALASGQILVGDGSSVVTARTVTGDIALSSIGDAQITAGAIVNADINAAAAIAHSKLASVSSAQLLIGDGSGVLTGRSISGDVTLSNLGDIQITAGAIVDADISGSAAISLSKLAEAVIQADGGQAFTANQSMGGFKLTSVGTPTSGTDVANKDYVDGIANGLDWKGSVRAATTANITLSGAQTVDGVSLVAGNRVLVKDQTAGDENGIYAVAAGAWTRTADADNSPAGEVTSGMATFVEEGTANGSSSWALTTPDPITLDTTALVFTQINGLGQINSGTGLTKTGNTLNVGAGNGILANADDVAVLADATGGANLARAINVSSNGVAVKIDGATVKENGSLQIYVDQTALTAVNAAQLDGLDSLDFLRSTASSNLTNGNTLTVNSGGFINFSVETGLKIGGTSLTTTIAELNAIGSIAVRETPSGLVDGSNAAYTLANTPIAGTEEVFLNGVLQEPGAGNDYTISGASITFLSAPAVGSRIKVSYRF
jgi:hypothetical protein